MEKLITKKKINAVTLSSTEAEFVSLTECVKTRFVVLKKKKKFFSFKENI